MRPNATWVEDFERACQQARLLGLLMSFTGWGWHIGGEGQKQSRIELIEPRTS